MKKNVGCIDRALRIIAGIALLSLFFLLEGNARFLGLIGFVPLLTGLMSFCPIYPILGISTCSKCSDEKSSDADKKEETAASSSSDADAE